MRTDEVPLLDYLTETDKTLSRTIINKSVSVSTSPQKKRALLDGNDLAIQNDTNRVLVSEYLLWRKISLPQQHADYLTSLLTLAELTGFRLFPEGIFRTWAYTGSHDLAFPPEQRVPPSDIFESLTELSGRAHEMFSSAVNTEDALRIIAGIEWDLSVGPIHPFYDACGRISRYYSTLLSLWLSVPVADRGDRATYFKFSNRGRTAFQDYFLSRPRLLILAN